MSRKKTLGERVRELRKVKGLMQYELAEKIGITPVALCRIEYGQATPTLQTLKGISRILGVTLDELAGK